MRAEELLELLRVRPFVPLRIHMTDGATYDIRHPDLVSVTLTEAIVGQHGPKLLLYVHDASLSGIAARSFASALLAWLLTVPGAQPSVEAICSSDMSS